jgi:hypothetical protein
MLTRIRIEVEGEDSAAATEEALTKYEHALQVTEAQRHGIAYGDGGAQYAEHWKVPGVERDHYNSQLGREVTDEVIEYDPSLPGYKGRRVVCFKRIDTRSPAFTEPKTEAATSTHTVITQPLPQSA